MPSSPPPPSSSFFWGDTPEDEYYASQDVPVGTAREALRMTNYVQNNFDKVTVPFLALHGTLDGLALHSGSEMLYEKAMTAKEDKALKLYEGMYHSLISGEPDENVDIVLADMKTWIDEQTQNSGPICADN
nr:caffeoylshikimate esterase-like [Tanacetum cinerariifolium]